MGRSITGGKDWADGEWDDLRPPSRSLPDRWPYAIWAAVIHRAVEDSEGHARFLQTYGSQDTQLAKRRLRDDAARWLLSPHAHPGSFRWVCRETGTDWTAAREAHLARLSRRWGRDFLERFGQPQE